MSSRWLTVLIAAGLPMLATVLAFSGVLACDFVSFDDREYVVRNPQVTNGLSAAAWTYAWTTSDLSNWHPLMWLSLQLDATLWGADNPRGFHAVNLALHTIDVGLVFLVLWIMTGAVVRSSLVAAFWGLHPLHVESVAWVAERKDVLSTLFLLLTLLAYVGYVRRPGWLRYLIILLLFAAGLLTKPMLVTVPILLILLDVWPLARISWREVRDPSPEQIQRFRWLALEKIPLFVMAFVMGLVTIAVQQEATWTLKALPWTARVANMFVAYGWYLQKTFVPTDLTVFYPHHFQDVSVSRAIVSALVLLVITGIVLRLGRAKPYLLVGWLWFVISLLPVIGLLQVGAQAYADRYVYVPHLGLFVLLVWSGAELAERWRPAAFVLPVLVAVGLVGCVALTRQQVTYWRNSETLWSHALDVDPDNDVAHMHFGDIEQDREHWEAAIAHLSKALSAPQSANHAAGFWNWGLCLAALDRDAEAEEKFRHALQIQPRHAEMLQSLIDVLKRQGKTGELPALYARKEQLLAAKAKGNPTDVDAQIRWGLVLARQGRVDQALPYFERAVRLDPQSAVAHYNLGMALAAKGTRVKAIAEFRRALELNPNMADAHFSLAEALEAEGDQPSAREHYSVAWRLKPDDAEAQARAEKLGGVIPSP